MNDRKRALVIAARAAIERHELDRDGVWLKWMRTKPGDPRHDEWIALLHSLDARIVRKQREIAELEGKSPARFIEAV